MSEPRIFSLTLGTTATKLRGNRQRSGILIQNLSGETVYISNSGNVDTVQALTLFSGCEYEAQHTGELYLWATGVAVVVIEENVQ